MRRDYLKPQLERAYRAGYAEARRYPDFTTAREFGVWWRTDRTPHLAGMRLTDEAIVRQLTRDMKFGELWQAVQDDMGPVNSHTMFRRLRSLVERRRIKRAGGVGPKGYTYSPVRRRRR